MIALHHRFVASSSSSSVESSTALPPLPPPLLRRALLPSDASAAIRSFSFSRAISSCFACILSSFEVKFSIIESNWFCTSQPSPGSAAAAALAAAAAAARRTGCGRARRWRENGPRGRDTRLAHPHQLEQKFGIGLPLRRRRLRRCALLGPLTVQIPALRVGQLLGRVELRALAKLSSGQMLLRALQLDFGPVRLL